MQQSSVESQYLLGVWGRSANDVYAVGHGYKIWHYNGSSWSEEATVSTSSLRSIWGCPEGEIFAVGFNGDIWHYDGSSWAKMTSPTTEVLYGVWGTSCDNVFAVGWGGTILHYDGSTWHMMTSGTADPLYGVWGTSCDNVFAVGWLGMILRYDGSTWQEMPSDAVHDLTGVWGTSSDDVFAVGSYSSIFHYDGSSWAKMDCGTCVHLQGVWGISSDDVFAVGYVSNVSGHILHYCDPIPSPTPTPTPTPTPIPTPTPTPMPTPTLTPTPTPEPTPTPTVPPDTCIDPIPLFFNDVPTITGTSIAQSEGTIVDVGIQVVRDEDNKYWDDLTSTWIADPETWNWVVDDLEGGVLGPWGDNQYDWDYNAFTLLSAGNLADGKSYTFGARAKDDDGYSDGSPYERSFTFDSTAPDVAISTNIPATLNTLTSVQGAAADASPGQLDQVLVQVRDMDNNLCWNGWGWEPVVADIWLTATGTTSWQISTTTTPRLPGWNNNVNYEIEAKAWDKASNQSASVTKGFLFRKLLDAASCYIDPVAANPSEPYVNALDTITGTSRGRGANAVDELLVKITWKTSPAQYWNGATWQGFFDWAYDGLDASATLALQADGQYDWDSSTIVLPAWLYGQQYEVQVRANDASDGTPYFSNTCFLTFDNQKPDTAMGLIPITVYNSLTKIDGTAVDNAPGKTETVLVTIERDSDNKYWNGSFWQPAQAWIKAKVTPGTGSRTWEISYSTTPRLPQWCNGGDGDGIHYTVTAEAVDRAGNRDATASKNFKFKYILSLMPTPTPTPTPGDEVVFPDPNLEAAIREAIGKPTGPIYESDLVGLIWLDASERNIADITGLEYCTSLTNLQLWGNQISDISHLAGLTSLTNLLLHQNQISDISHLAGLTSLTGLHLWSNQISDISPLAGLTSLTHLALEGNQISDISPLAGLTSLTNLGLDNNQISDISPLAGLTSLTSLWLDNNQISDISPLVGLTSLTDLYLHYNQISDISPLTGLTSLTYLWLWSNQISDISPLAGLTSLTDLYLEGNQISDISPLAGLTSLTTLGLWGNQISDISPLAGLTSLTSLGLGGNQISDISPLAGLTSLAYLYLYCNQISDISPLAGLTSLTLLDLVNNQISDILSLVDNVGISSGDLVDLKANPLHFTSINVYIPQLQARGVEVLYDEPTPYDVNGDGYVNEADMTLVYDHFGETGEPGWIPEDVKQDGRIDVLDMILVGQHWTE